MILHYHYSDREYSGEIRRIKNMTSLLEKDFLKEL